MNLWNDLGFSLYVVPSICHMIAILENRKKSEMGVSANFGMLLLNTGDQVQ